MALLNEANHQARALARGLDPVHVEAKGIVAALQGLALQSQDLYGIECVFSCAHEHLALKAEPGLALYRIAQEAVRNAAVHGQAQRIQIELALEKAKLRLSIRDDGKGFGRVPKLQSGLGMRTMRYRAEAVGGTLQVESSPAEGTRVCCLLPVEHCLKR